MEKNLFIAYIGLQRNDWITFGERSYISVGSTRRKHRRDAQPTLLSSGERTLQTLRAERAVDLHQRSVCAADDLPSAQTAPRPDQGQRGGGEGRGSGHHPGQCDGGRRHA